MLSKMRNGGDQTLSTSNDLAILNNIVRDKKRKSEHIRAYKSVHIRGWVISDIAKNMDRYGLPC